MLCHPQAVPTIRARPADEHRKLIPCRNSLVRDEIDDDRAKILMRPADDDSHSNTLTCGEALSTVLLECAMPTCPMARLTEHTQPRLCGFRWEKAC